MDSTQKIAPVAPISQPITPKKSRVWIWVLVVVGILLIMGGIAIAAIVAGIAAVTNSLDVTTNTNSADVNLGTTLDNTNGYQLTFPSDWTVSSDDSTEGYIDKNYEFTYYDEVNGTTTNHFVVRRIELSDAPDTTLGQYSSDFVASLDEGIKNGDFNISKTENRTFGVGDYQGYVVILSNDETAEQNYYVMTVQNGVAYELAVFYFKDQETMALADFEEVVATFVAE